MIIGKDAERQPMSVAVITKNEEKRLPRCLKSVSFADEVLVVDSGSTDGTVEVARSLGARVIIEQWRGFSEQKQFAVNQCIHDWVLVLDADERVPDETALVIARELGGRDGNISAYRFRRKNFLHGRWIRHSGWWPDPVVRLVDRRRGAFDGRPVHERWVAKGSVKGLDVPIEHFSFSGYSDLVAKMETYSNLASSDLYERRFTAGPFSPLTHGAWMFLKTYFLEMGLLDGFDGFMISVMNAGGSFLKYAKLRELCSGHPGGK